MSQISNYSPGQPDKFVEQFSGYFYNGPALEVCSGQLIITWQ
jgi:hypothetical protein